MAASIPEPLRRRPFTSEIATVWRLSRRQVHRLNLHTPFRGVWSTTPLESVAQQCAAMSLVVECHCFSHLTAARLHGLPLPRSLEDDEAIHVMRDARDGTVRRRGLVGHTGLFSRDVVDVDGIPVTNLADTWVDMGELIRPGVPLGLDDLVIMGDAVADRLGSIDPLVEALETRKAPRGKRTLLEALSWVRVGSESSGETRTRLILVRAGLPEPELNESVYASGGHWLGRPDMRWVKQRLLLEYQGRDFHDGDEQRVKDEVRFARFSRHDWSVLPVWDNDVNSDEAREALAVQVANELGHPIADLNLTDIHPRFFSMRMLELAELRRRRLRAQSR